MVSMDRRKFIGLMGASAAGAFALSPLQALLARKAMGQNPVVPGFGPLNPKLPANIDPRVTPVFDLNSAGPLLEVPQGFDYAAFHVSGMQMSDGNKCPSDHDGMACFVQNPGRNPRYILVQNHELSPGEEDGSGFTGGTGLKKAYDRFDGDGSPGIGAGGTSNIVVDSRGNVERDYVSLAGTIRNCAGGPTPRGSWLSCEENVTVPRDDERVTQKHGYVFEVPAKGSQRPPVPIVAMGRFNHEAVAVDPETNYIYQTEDRGDSVIYRYLPKNPRQLEQGGELQVLKVMGLPQDTRDIPANVVNSSFDVEWISLTQRGVNVDPEEDNLREIAAELGASIFRRGEGAWSENGKIYWVCTTGGVDQLGQVWAYDDPTKQVTLAVQSNDKSALDKPDNITVSPSDGSLYLCEDGGGEQFVVGVTPDGGLFKLCRNNINTSEFAGACFSPDGTKLFFNIQTPGITFMLYRQDGQPIVPMNA